MCSKVRWGEGCWQEIPVRSVAVIHGVINLVLSEEKVLSFIIIIFIGLTVGNSTCVDIACIAGAVHISGLIKGVSSFHAEVFSWKHWIVKPKHFR